MTETGREGCERSERREERRKIGALERKGEERTGEGQKRKGMEGWVKREQPGIVQPRA